MKKQTIRKTGLTLAVLAGIIAGTALTVSAEEEERVLRYGYTAANSDVLPGLQGIALQQGFFEEELAKVNAVFEPIPFAKAGPAINQALASDELDIGNLGDVPSAVAKAGGADTVLIDAQPSDYGTHLVIRNDLDISQVSELKCLTVAVQTGSYMQRILYQILEKNGITPEDVELVNMSEVDAANAIAGGSIDATPVSEMKGVTLETSGSAQLLFDTEGDPELARITTWVARSEYAEENGDIITAYFKALLRAQEYALENPEELREIYIASGTSEEIIDQVYPELTDFCTTVGATEETLSNYQAVSDFLLENELTTEELTISEWFHGEFFENAQES